MAVNCYTSKTVSDCWFITHDEVSVFSLVVATWQHVILSFISSDDTPLVDTVVLYDIAEKPATVGK